jgi:hypothetical protein
LSVSHRSSTKTASAATSRTTFSVPPSAVGLLCLMPVSRAVCAITESITAAGVADPNEEAGLRDAGSLGVILRDRRGTVSPKSKKQFRAAKFLQRVCPGHTTNRQPEFEWRKDLHTQTHSQTQRDYERVCKLGACRCITPKRSGQCSLSSVYGGAISLQVAAWIVFRETYAANRHHPCGAAAAVTRRTG